MIVAVFRKFHHPKSGIKYVQIRQQLYGDQEEEENSEYIKTVARGVHGLIWYSSLLKTLRNILFILRTILLKLYSTPHQKWKLTHLPFIITSFLLFISSQYLDIAIFRSY